MFLSLCVFLYTVLHSNLSARKKLPVHLRNGQICATKVVIADESVTFAGAIFDISGDFGADDHAEVTKRLI